MKADFFLWQNQGVKRKWWSCRRKHSSHSLLTGGTRSLTLTAAVSELANETVGGAEVEATFFSKHDGRVAGWLPAQADAGGERRAGATISAADETVTKRRCPGQSTESIERVRTTSAWWSRPVGWRIRVAAVASFNVAGGDWRLGPCLSAPTRRSSSVRRQCCAGPWSATTSAQHLFLAMADWQYVASDGTGLVRTPMDGPFRRWGRRWR